VIEKEWKAVRPGEINELIEMNIYCRNGRADRHENGLPEKISRPEVDYALAAYSLFDEDIEGFLARMIDIAREGIFIVFRGSPPGTLSEFAYHLPLEMVQKQYGFSNKKAEQIVDRLRSEGQLQERKDGLWASFSTKDALLYLMR
jgi:hypothetical protein